MKIGILRQARTDSPPLVGGVRGGGARRLMDRPGMGNIHADGLPPYPNPLPQGGGIYYDARLSLSRRSRIGTRHARRYDGEQ